MTDGELYAQMQTVETMARCGVTAREVAQRLGLNTRMANWLLGKMAREGTVVRTTRETPGPQGGRPAFVWRAHG
jgi:predicted ArsR family transcriptional regulator